MVLDMFGRVPPRAYEAAMLERALAYPWARPAASCLLAGDDVTLLSEMRAAQRDEVSERLTSGERHPLLAIGSNGSPAVLALKFAHFEDGADRTALVLTGHLHDFDVGAAASLAMYGAFPATLFASPGTAVRAALLWVTPAQFTQLAWSELSYRLGRLQARFHTDEDGLTFDHVLAFVSRFGAICIDGEPVALEAVPALGRTARAVSQRQLLEHAAPLIFGGPCTPEELVRSVHEDRVDVFRRAAATVRRTARPFDAVGWRAWLSSPNN